MKASLICVLTFLALAIGQGDACEPGTTTYDGCNTCTCGHDGLTKACTLMACGIQSVRRVDSATGHSDETNLSDRIKRDVQVQSSHEMNPYKRLLRIRSVSSPQPQVCSPGTTKMIECNRCFCLADGSGWGCTLMGCLPQDYLLTTPKPSVVP